MSSKTQLQTNNSALDGYIARINAAKEVVASLPEAGSGGGSGVNTIKITSNGPVLYGFDANGNALTISGNKSGEFLHGIVYCQSPTVIVTGRSKKSGNLYIFSTEGFFTFANTDPA